MSNGEVSYSLLMWYVAECVIGMIMSHLQLCTAVLLLYYVVARDPACSWTARLLL